jgi:hypothetical protein
MGGKADMSLVGDILPGGRNGCLVGEVGRDVLGVAGLYWLMLEAGREGGSIASLP